MRFSSKKSKAEIVDECIKTREIEFLIDIFSILKTGELNDAVIRGKVTHFLNLCFEIIFDSGGFYQRIDCEKFSKFSGKDGFKYFLEEYKDSFINIKSATEYIDENIMDDYEVINQITPEISLEESINNLWGSVFTAVPKIQGGYPELVQAQIMASKKIKVPSLELSKVNDIFYFLSETLNLFHNHIASQPYKLNNQRNQDKQKGTSKVTLGDLYGPCQTEENKIYRFNHNGLNLARQFLFNAGIITGFIFDSSGLAHEYLNLLFFDDELNPFDYKGKLSIISLLLLFSGYFYASTRVDETNGNPKSNRPAAVKLINYSYKEVLELPDDEDDDL